MMIENQKNKWKQAGKSIDINFLKETVTSCRNEIECGKAMLINVPFYLRLVICVVRENSVPINERLFATSDFPFTQTHMIKKMYSFFSSSWQFSNDL